MNDTQKDIARKALKAWGVIVILCFYFAGMFGALRYNISSAMNPSFIVKCSIEHGYPWGGFLLLLLKFSLVAFFSIWRAIDDAGNMDKMGRLFKMATDRQVYGDSHFETPEEFEDVALVQHPEDAYGTILGQMDMSGRHVVNFRMDEMNRLNQHIAIVGASGSGKTYTFTKNYVFQAAKRRESLILTDPDGGLYKDMAGWLIDHGYKVRRFDLRRLEKSDGWDCLRSIDAPDEQNLQINAQIFAQTAISNMFRADDIDKFPAPGCLSLLTALVLKVYLGHEFKPEQRNISTVYQCLQEKDGEEFLKSLFDEDSMADEEKICLGPYRSFLEGSPNMRGVVMSTLATKLQVFQSSMVRKVLSTNDIDLVAPGKETCAYFCVFPDNHATFKFVVSLFFSMLMMNLTNYADDQREGYLPVPVDFLLDEFPSIGVLPDWERKMATVRKRHINVAMIFQDITQLQNNYKDSWVTLLSNCSTFLSLGINDQYTSEMVTMRAGDTTVEVQTQQHQAIESIFTVYRPFSTGEGKRSLLSYDELFRLKPDDSIILFQSHYPVWLKKFPYVNHPEAENLRKIYPEDIPNINDEAARAKRAAENDTVVQAYRSEHPIADERSYDGLCESEPTKSLLQALKQKILESVDRRKRNPATTSECGLSKPVNKSSTSEKTSEPICEDVTIYSTDFYDLSSFLASEQKTCESDAQKEALKESSHVDEPTSFDPSASEEQGSSNAPWECDMGLPSPPNSIEASAPPVPSEPNETVSATIESKDTPGAARQPCRSPERQAKSPLTSEHSKLNNSNKGKFTFSAALNQQANPTSDNGQQTSIMPPAKNKGYVDSGPNEK